MEEKKLLITQEDIMQLLDKLYDSSIHGLQKGIDRYQSPEHRQLMG